MARCFDVEAILIRVSLAPSKVKLETVVSPSLAITCVPFADGSESTLLPVILSTSAFDIPHDAFSRRSTAHFAGAVAQPNSRNASVATSHVNLSLIVLPSIHWGGRYRGWTRNRPSRCADLRHVGKRHRRVPVAPARGVALRDWGALQLASIGNIRGEGIAVRIRSKIRISAGIRIHVGVVLHTLVGRAVLVPFAA